MSVAKRFTSMFQTFPFGVQGYTGLQVPFFNTKLYQKMPVDGEPNWLLDNENGVSLLSPVHEWIIHWG